MLAYPVAIASNPEWHDFDHGPDHDARSTYPANLLVEEYTLTEKVRSAAALIDTFALMYPQLQDVDFRRDVPRLDVPVFIVEGEHEAPGRAVLAVDWFEQLSAPSKELVTFESSGHTPHLHEPGRFATYLADVVLPQTYRAVKADVVPDPGRPPRTGARRRPDTLSPPWTLGPTRLVAGP